MSAAPVRVEKLAADAKLALSACEAIPALVAKVARPQTIASEAMPANVARGTSSTPTVTIPADTEVTVSGDRRLILPAVPTSVPSSLMTTPEPAATIFCS